MASQISTTGLNPGNFASAAVPVLDHSQPDNTQANQYNQLAEDLSRMGSAAANLMIETKNESNRRKKAAAEYAKRKKEEEDLANKSNAQRLFNLKGGRDLPEKETAWSPAAGNIENLEHANEGLRKEYSVLFAESKINEEQAFIDKSSKDYANKWYQEYLALDDGDALKGDYTKYAALRAVELKSERFADNLNGLSGITEATNRTKLDYSSIESSIAEIQQEHIDRKQAEFLDNYVDTDYQGGKSGGGDPLVNRSYDNRVEGPPQTPEELFALLNRMQSNVNRGNGLEALYSRDQLHDSVIDNYTQRYELAKTSEDPIFNAQKLFDSAVSGMKLTDLQGGVGEKYRKFQKGLHARFVFLRNEEEKAAKATQKKLDEDLDMAAYGAVNDISNLHQEAEDNPGTVTAVQIDKLENILLSHHKQGAFSSQTEEDEFSQAREKISAIRKLIDPTSKTYVPVEDELKTLGEYRKELSNINTTTELRKLHIEAINNEPNPWLSKEKILAVAAQREFLEDFSKEDKISPEQEKASNSSMWNGLKPIREAHFECLNNGKCEKYNSLSTGEPPKDLLGKDFEAYKKQIAKWDEDQGKAGHNTVKVAGAKAASHINQELGAGNFSLLKARKEFQKLNNPTESQILAFDTAVRKHHEKVAAKDKKVFKENSLVERGSVFTNIDSVETLADLDTKKAEIPLNQKLTGDDKRFLQTKVNSKRKEIKTKLAKTKDTKQSAEINQKLLNFTDGEITNETLKSIQADVDGMTWHGNAGNNFRTFITGLIHKNVSAEKAKAEIKKYNDHDAEYQTATNKTEQELNLIVKAVADGILTPEQAKEDIEELKTNFDTDNSALLAEGKKIKYKASHQGLFTQALKDSGTGDSTNKERKRKEKLIEKRRDEVQALEDFKSDEKLLAVKAITPALKLKTVAELEKYRDDQLPTMDDSDAKVVFVKEINKIIAKRENGEGVSKDELARLSGLLKATYLDRIKNSNDITKLNALKPTIAGDLGLRGQHAGQVSIAITYIILKINKTTLTNDSLTIADNIDKTLYSASIIDQDSLDAAIATADTIKDPAIKRTTITRLQGIKGKIENRTFNSEEYKKELALKFKTNRYLSTIDNQILDLVTTAKDANLNFRVETSDKTVKKAIGDLESLLTAFKTNEDFTSTMEQTGSTKWQDKFTKGIGQLKDLQSEVSKQAIAKENYAAHKESLKSREADRTRVQEDLISLQENYTPEAHDALRYKIKDYGADLVDEDGNISNPALFKNTQQAQLLRAANVAKELDSTAPKTTDQNTLTTLYTEYADKLSVGMENPQELIKAGKTFLQDEFIGGRVSNSDYKYFENKLNSYNPKAIKTQDGRMRSLETIDSIFRTSNTEGMLNPKFMIAVKGQGSWQEGNMLREELRSKFMAEWQAQAGSFEGDKAKSYKWATEYAKSLISIDPDINPFPENVSRIVNWTGGAFDVGKGGKAGTSGTDAPTGNLNTEQTPDENLVDQILNR